MIAVQRPKHLRRHHWTWYAWRLGLWGATLGAFAVMVYGAFLSSYVNPVTPPPLPDAPEVSVRATPEPTQTAVSTPTPKPVRFKDCREAAEAGALPMEKGDPGYSKKLDTDRDGRACENYD